MLFLIGIHEIEIQNKKKNTREYLFFFNLNFNNHQEETKKNFFFYLDELKFNKFLITKKVSKKKSK